jgi:hypothetical protein
MRTAGRTITQALRDRLVWRLALAGLLGLLFAGLLAEAAFAGLAGESRAPGRVELVIPPGTAERVAGGQAPPELPADMSFVTGDVLVVRNADAVSHQLGPLWVPPGASASLALDEPNRYSYACSFQTSRYLGLTVRSQATLWTRLQAMLLVAPPTAALFALYSIVVWPLPKRQA